MADNTLIYGIHSVAAAIEEDASQLLELWLEQNRRDDRLNTLRELARVNGISVQQANRKTLDRMTTSAAHQGAVARCRMKATLSPRHSIETLLNTVTEDLLLLVLDGVTDPHNLGACLRTAEAAGAHAVIVPGKNAAGLTPVVRKVAAGSAERVPLIVVTNLARSLRQLRQANIWLIGADGHSERSLYDINLSRPVALVLGAEGRGLRRLTREECDEVCGLPMFGQAESLNVSVAAGVCLYEAVRQRIQEN